MLSSGRGYWFKRQFYLLAYIIPGAVVWACVGLAIWPLSRIAGLIPSLIWIYTLLFGIFETGLLPISAPSLTWQVPAQWIRGHSPFVQTLIWGTCLGPGLVTRNPYAGMWLLPLFIALNQNLLAAVIIGMAIGGIHGAARALGVLCNRKELDTSCPPIHFLGVHHILGTQWRWRLIDGLILLVVTGAFVAAMLPLLSRYF